MIFNPKLIADRFCDYFTNVDPNLAKTIPKASSTFQSYLDGNFINSLFFEPTTSRKLVKSLIRFIIVQARIQPPTLTVADSNTSHN